jgi:hypothetical protein
MISTKALESISGYRERTINVKIYSVNDQDFLSRLKRDFTDECSFEVSLSDGESPFGQDDQIIFGQTSIYIQQFRIGEIYVKDNGSTDAKVDTKRYVCKYDEISGITATSAFDREYLLIHLKKGDIITSVGIPTNKSVSMLANDLHSIITENKLS